MYILFLYCLLAAAGRLRATKWNFVDSLVTMKTFLLSLNDVLKPPPYPWRTAAVHTDKDGVEGTRYSSIAI